MQFLRTAVVATVVTLSGIPSVDAFFRLNCYKIQTGRVDPIVNPGAVSAHAHTIVGASNIGVNATFDTLFSSECTSCEVGEDKSAYWTPNLYYQHPNGSFEEVPHTGSVVYYLTRGPNMNNLTMFPKGFMMLSGNKALRAYNQSGMTWGNTSYPSRPIGEAVNFACLQANAVPETYNMTNVQSCINGLRAQLQFQTCWNGIDLYKADNSHVAHLSHIDDGVCPPTHPYQMPHIFIETNYAVNQVSNNTNGGRYVFSQGDPTGYGFHGDFINGWNPDVLQKANDDCIINGGGQFGTIDECPILIQSDTAYAQQNCPERPQQIAEQVKGMLDRLPGCVTVVDGPQAATAAQMECAAGIPQPSISTTKMSTVLPTAMPKAGDQYGNPFNKYVGCGNDSYGSPLRTVNAISTTNSQMTVEYCQTYCTKRGYPISGVENGNQCFCDLAVNPTANITDAYQTRYGCAMFCTGNASEYCGGQFYMNVYNNTDPSLHPTNDTRNSVYQLTVPIAPFPKNYLGCAHEGNNGARALNASSFAATNMTVDACAAYCRANDYALYGVEYATQCYCGNGLASGAAIVDTSTSTDIAAAAVGACNFRCAGNYSQMCGGSGTLSVYNNTAYVPVGVKQNVGRYVTKGCLTEPSGARALPATQWNDAAMTVDKCVKYCLGKKYHYAGVEYGTQCFCDNKITAGAVQGQCDTSTLMKCPGDASTYCGAGNLLNLYYSSTL